MRKSRKSKGYLGRHEAQIVCALHFGCSMDVASVISEAAVQEVMECGRMSKYAQQYLDCTDAQGLRIWDVQIHHSLARLIQRELVERSARGFYKLTEGAEVFAHR